MKNILFTCHSLKELAGTEIITLSLTNYFLERDWKVDVFTLDYGEPFCHIIDGNVNVVCLDNIGHLDKEYEVIWGHQHPTLDYVLFVEKIKGKRVYYESLSFYMPIEAFPVYYKSLTMNGVVSCNAKKHLAEKGFDTQGMFVFPNYATKNFFDMELELSNKVSNIAVITNHIPDELNELPLLASKKSIKVDIYGMHHTYKFVDEKLLAKYDVVISIGKTIFYSIAMGIPSYSYDKGVSTGYINKENFHKNFETNFAFRDVYKPKTAEEILEDILNGYNTVVKDSTYLKKEAKKLFFFDKLMDEFLEIFFNESEMNYIQLYNDFPTLPHISKLYVEDIVFWKNEAQKWYKKSLELGEIINHNEKFIGNLSEEIDEMINSKSWKITSPLRKIMNIKKK